MGVITGRKSGKAEDEEVGRGIGLGREVWMRGGLENLETTLQSAECMDKGDVLKVSLLLDCR